MGFTPQLSGLPARPGLRQAERGGVLPCVAQPLSGDALAAWATSITQPCDGSTPKEWAPGLVRASSGRAGLRTPPCVAPLPDDAFAPWSVLNAPAAPTGDGAEVQRRAPSPTRASPDWSSDTIPGVAQPLLEDAFAACRA